MESFNNLIAPNTTEIISPINDIKKNFDSAVQNGLESEELVKMTCVMELLSHKVVTTEDFQRHNKLFLQLFQDGDFSAIGGIFTQLTLGKKYLKDYFKNEYYI